MEATVTRYLFREEPWGFTVEGEERPPVRVAFQPTGLEARYLGVDDTRERGNQVGYRAEGGVRLEGSGAAVELFIAGERRIDPYPLEFGTATWFSAGFRLMSR